MIRTLIAATVAAALALPCAALAAEKAPGKERAELFIATLMKVKKDEGKLTDAEKAANAKLFLDLDSFLNFENLTAKPIAPRADKLKAEEMTSFKSKFKELIRMIAYPKSGNFFRTAKLEWQPEKVQGELILVPLNVKLPEEDLETTVEFQFSKSAGLLKIEDVLFEGDSLVKDYQNQIAKIVDKSGVPGLFKVLDEKQAELSKPVTPKK
ncbi:MAG TPA: ABC transporter substrate-binding protein [Myxococcales bacterium]|jgi:ABC-type transporter MlaC component